MVAHQEEDTERDRKMKEKTQGEMHWWRERSKGLDVVGFE